MPLVTTKEMLTKAKKEKFAIAAFNAENMEMVQAIIAAAQAQNAPVIIQTTPGTLRYGSMQLYYNMVAALAKSTPMPIAIHLDHGNTFEQASKAFRVGYTSIMIDGSQKPFAENIQITKQVVDLCHSAGVAVEAELGLVGGKEDDTENETCGYADVQEAIEFAAKTSVDSLAVGVGTAHGVYTVTPVLNTALITDIQKAIDLPLVLHGGSGLQDDVLQDCIHRGMCKVNFATELRIAYTNAVKNYLENNPDTIDPKKYGEQGRAAVQNFVEGKMQVCGCSGKAGLL